MRPANALAIAGIPPSLVQLAPGRFYAVMCDEGAPAAALAAASLLAVEKGVWVAEAEPVAADLPVQAMEEGRVRVFIRQDAGKGSVESLAEELDYFGVSRNTLVVIDGTDRLVAGPSLAFLKQWAEARGLPLLLLVSRHSGRPDPASSLRREADRFAGFARLRKHEAGLRWEVFHWFGPAGAVTGQSFSLRLEGGRLAALAENLPEAISGPAVDEDVVLALASALEGGQAPAFWTVVESLDALPAATVGAVAATVILSFGLGTSLDQLAREVFRLRRACGLRLKIVVREVNARLRYSQEKLLLRVGTNLVVPAEVSFSRQQSLVATVQHQIFPRALEADYEAEVAKAMPAGEQGYLPPVAFAKAVEGALSRSEALAVQSVLVQLPLVPGLTPPDALRYCSMTRPGDVCTADEGSLYLFLFACRENDVAATLDRLFRLPVTELFDEELRYLSAETIRAALEALPTGESAPDYGAALIGAAEPAASSSHAHLSGETFRRHAALSAVPRPLPLRLKTA